MNTIPSTRAGESAPHDVHSTVRTISLGTLWRALRYPFILLSFALIPRMMGDQDYGRYAYFVSAFVLLDMATDLGFLQVFGRFVPECQAQGDDRRLRVMFYHLMVYGTALALLMVLGVGLFVAVRPREGVGGAMFWFLAALLLLTRVEGTFFSLLYGLNRIAQFSAKEMVRSAATLVLVLAFYKAAGLPGAFLGLVLNEVLLTMLGAWWVRAYLSPPTWRFDWREIRAYALFGVTFYVPALLFGMLQRVGNVFVQWWTRANEEVAYYDMANQYLLLTATFLGLILQTLLPALTHLHLRNDRDAIRRWQGIVLTYCGLAAFLAFNALLWFGDLFIRRWLGENFLPALPNAKIVTLAMAPILLTYAGMNFALLEKSARVYLAGVALGVMAMTALSWGLIPKHASLGAAWATVAGYSALAATFLFRYWREFRYMMSGLAMAVVIGALFAAFARPVHSWGAAVSFFSLTSAAYLVVLTLLRVIRVSDFIKLLAAFRSRSEDADCAG